VIRSQALASAGIRPFARSPSTGSIPSRGNGGGRRSNFAGFDLVFSAPKSVSLLHALGSDNVRLAINHAHAAAWQAALRYLEEEACVTRRGRNGVVREYGSGFVAAAYQHRTSRAQDPQLHTHVIVANMARSPSDDTWRALDGEPLLATYRLAAGYLYQAHLRFELTRSLGVAWERPVMGTAELTGIPEGVLRAFSQRRAAVVDYLAEQGTSGFYAAKTAALARRALEQIRAGAGRDYLAFAAQRERLVVADDPLAARARLVADWWSAARDDLGGNVMLAFGRRDVAELNAVARRLMDEHGRLGTARLVADGREFAPGDRIVCRRNSAALGVRNGSRATVERIDAGRLALAVRTDCGERVNLTRRYLEAGHVRHGYALTGHASQGLTVERAFVLGEGRGQLKEWGYVALSRARRGTRLYVTANALDAESHGAEPERPDSVNRFAEALERSDAELLASEQPRSSRARLIEQQRLATERARVRAETKVNAARRQLAALGPFGRVRRGQPLRVEIAREEAVLRMAEGKLRQLERLAHTRTRPPAGLARPVARAPQREPELPGLDLGL
jgi:conjugative relaxase-like TrwC/TraI family protein